MGVLRRKKIEKKKIIGTKAFLFLLTILFLFCIGINQQNENEIIKIGGISPSISSVRNFIKRSKQLKKSFEIKNRREQIIKDSEEEH